MKISKKLSALALATALERDAGWLVHPDFPVLP